MKFFKKAFIACVGVLSLSALAACDNSDVEGAAKRVQVVNDKSEAVTGDFEVARTVLLNDVKYTVTWESNNDYCKVKEIDGNADKYLIDIDYLNNQSTKQDVKLTATVKAEKGKKTVTKEFNFSIPQFVVNTIAQADEAKDGTNINLKGVIVAKEAYNAKSKNTNVYLQCAEGGFEGYQLTCTEEQYNTELLIGNTLYVAGPKSYYNGLRETKPSSYNLAEEPQQTLVAEDLTSVLNAGNGISTAYQCHYAKLTDVEIVSVGAQDSSGQFSITVGDKTNTKKQTVVRISKYFAAKDSDLWKEYTGLNLVAGQKITVTGFVGWYNGAQITPFEKGAIVAGDKIAEDVLGLSLLNQVSFPSKVYGVKNITLPSSLYQAGVDATAYAGYTAEWSAESENVTITTKNIPAVEAKAATETTPAVAAVPAYTTHMLATKKVDADETVTVKLSVKKDGTEVFTGSKTLKLVKDVVIDTHDAYIKAAKGDSVTVQGYVSYLNKEATKANFTLTDDKGKAYYVYGMTVTVSSASTFLVASI